MNRQRLQLTALLVSLLSLATSWIVKRLGDHVGELDERLDELGDRELHLEVAEKDVHERLLAVAAREQRMNDRELVANAPADVQAGCDLVYGHDGQHVVYIAPSE